MFTKYRHVAKRTLKNLYPDRDFKSSARSKDIYGKNINLKREVLYTSVGLLVTLFATAFVFKGVFAILKDGSSPVGLKVIIEQLVFVIIVGFLIYGNIIYQMTRIAYMRRLQSHCRASEDELQQVCRDDAPSLTFLVPSYKEDSDVVRRTLLSAALQEYPNKRVVLLVDDPHCPDSKEDADALAAAIELPIEVQNMLEEVAGEMRLNLQNFLVRTENGELNCFDEGLYLSSCYDTIGSWFKEQAENYDISNHSKALFVEKIFSEPSQAYLQKAEKLKQDTMNGGCEFDRDELLGEYKRLVEIFSTELTSFERKKYINLSHEPNKAMNLNSYIGLLGESFCEVHKKGSLYIEPACDEAADITIPDTDYLITLDADSILFLDYAARLIHFMQQPANEKVAVIQTPYSAEPNAPGALESTAGATTDMQYIIHQGFTGYNATYWVGANALLRKKALKDIMVTEQERGFSVKRFIQDRTVIEDTESSIDMVLKGWKLHNYPERLSYSATPPDFGSLIIQRERWANGGLIILPKLLRYLVQRPFRLSKLTEFFVRFHYLTSTAAVNIGLPILLMCHFDKNLESLWLPLTCLPYFFFYARDLMQAGYRLVDLFRVYAFNLMLIPINVSGVFSSIYQGLTKKKLPFKRTPKIDGRTVSPPSYLLALYAIALYCVFGVAEDLLEQRWLHAGFSLVNGSFIIFAIHRFIGFKASAEDICRGLGEWRRSSAENFTSSLGQIKAFFTL